MFPAPLEHWLQPNSSLQIGSGDITVCLSRLPRLTSSSSVAGEISILTAICNFRSKITISPRERSERRPKSAARSCCLLSPSNPLVVIASQER